MKKFKIFTDERGGNLIPIEFNKIKFIPKRVFSVSDVPKNSIRGNHAHYETEQLLICIKGKIMVGLHNGHKEIKKIIQEGECIYVDKMVWDYQKFLTGKDFMIVLCSTNYDIKDYINDFKNFMEIVKKCKK